MGHSVGGGRRGYRGQWGQAGRHLRSWSLSDQDSLPPSGAHFDQPIEAFDQISGHCLIPPSTSATSNLHLSACMLFEVGSY